MKKHIKEFEAESKMFVSSELLEKLTNRNIEAFRLGDKVTPSFVICEKIRNPKWQFWKPKYRGILMQYIGRKP